MITSEDVASRLLQIKAIQISPQNPFTWASGLKSPIYCDNRLLLSYPEYRKEIILALQQKASESFPDYQSISGVATAGIAHGALLAARLHLPFSYVRSSRKAHGRRNAIEGRVSAGDRILVIEDLISTGGSSLRAVETLREQDVEVVGVLAIFQYGFPESITRFQQHHCAFATLCDYETMLKVALEREYIKPDAYRLLQNWHQDPDAWADQHAKD